MNGECIGKGGGGGGGIKHYRAKCPGDILHGGTSSTLTTCLARGLLCVDIIN